MSNKESYKELMSEWNEDMLFSDGLDDALIGICHQFGRPAVAAYDYEKLIDILMERDGMSYEEAVEFFEFNISGAWVGENTPVYIERISDEFDGSDVSPEKEIRDDRDVCFL